MCQRVTIVGLRWPNSRPLISARSTPGRLLQCNSATRRLEINRPYLHIGQSPGLARRRLPFIRWFISSRRPRVPVDATVRNGGYFDVASSPPSVRRYAQGTPQRRLHRARNRRRRRRVNAAARAGLGAVPTASRPGAARLDRRSDRLAARRLIFSLPWDLEEPAGTPALVSIGDGWQTEIAYFPAVGNAASIQARSRYIREIPDPSRSLTHLDRRMLPGLIAATGSY